MSVRTEQAAIFSRAIADILNNGRELSNDHDLSGAFGTSESRREFARQINKRAAEISSGLPTGDFLGVVNELDLSAVRTCGELIEVLLRHANAELEDDVWSAF